MAEFPHDVRWLVRVSGIADAQLYPFQTDEWQLTHGNPAGATLIIVNREGVHPTAADAQWIADAMAFDHDAPIDAAPAGSAGFGFIPNDPLVQQPVVPLDPFALEWSTIYWEKLNVAHYAAADVRFDTTYTLRYHDEEGSITPRFRERFAGREHLVRLYAMAARQVDVLVEYLCLYRVLEAADGENGKQFAASALPRLAAFDFGTYVIPTEVEPTEIDVFSEYRKRALDQLQEIEFIQQEPDVPKYLYAIRNSIAHGKRDVLLPGQDEVYINAARALYIVKLLARIAVEG